MNRALEVDMSIVMRHNDYLDARVPSVQWGNLPYSRELPMREKYNDDSLKDRMKMAEMDYPLQPDIPPAKQFKWDKATHEERYERADLRPHIFTQLENMEKQLTNTAFDFYGGYVKIAEP